MNNFRELIKFEYKKIFIRKSSWIALFLFTITLVFDCFAILIGNEYRDGVPVRSYYEAMKLDRKYARALTGREINADLILEVAKAFQKVPQEKSVYYTNMEEYERYARQYSAIYSVIRPIYNRTVKPDYGYEDLKMITPKIAESLYDYRIHKIKDTIDNYPVSKEMKEKLIAMDDDVVKPFTYEYYGGYDRFLNLTDLTGALSAFLIVFLIAPIFCGEYRGCDQLILSSKNGKNSLIKAKLTTVFSITAILSLSGLLLTYLLCMLVFGFDGKNAAFQLEVALDNFAFTMGELSMICVVTIFFACILSATITMFLSAKINSSFIVITISSALLIIPLFLKPSIGNRLYMYIYYLLPSNMMKHFNITDPIGFGFTILGHVVYPYIIMITFAIFTSALLIPFSYKSFKHHQVQ